MAHWGLFCNQYAFQKQVLKEYAATNMQQAFWFLTLALLRCSQRPTPARDTDMKKWGEVNPFLKNYLEGDIMTLLRKYSSKNIFCIDACELDGLGN